MKKRTICAAWRVHTPGLLGEVLSNPTAAILSKPLNIFGRLLAQVGERAAQINDLHLNALMMRLAIYEVADPYNKSAYNPEIVEKTFRDADRLGPIDPAKFVKHCTTNAARIGFELAQRGNVADLYAFLDEVNDAAQSLAAVECAKDFAWNEDGRTDWESACTALSIRIEKGLPCTVGAVRRIIRSV